jgi:peroxiredoxin-like protein
MEAHYYNINLYWTGDRKGEISSPDFTHSFEVATPPPFNKGIEGIWSPEHLFTGAVNSCFMSTFLAIAENSKLNFKSFSCTAKGKLEQIDNKFLMTAVLLYPVIEIVDATDYDKTLKILHKSEASCLISNSIKAQVTLEPTIKY